MTGKRSQRIIFVQMENGGGKNYKVGMKMSKPRLIGQFKPFKANRRYNWRWQKRQTEKRLPERKGQK